MLLLNCEYQCRIHAIVETYYTGVSNQRVNVMIFVGRDRGMTIENTVLTTNIAFLSVCHMLVLC